MINEWLESLSLLIETKTVIAPIMALIAGILTSLTPCSLSSIPLIISVVGATSKDSKKALKLSLLFAFGSALTFTTFGLLASMAGTLLGNNMDIWYLIMSFLMVLMSLQIWGLYEFIPSTYMVSKTTHKGKIGAFIAGILAGIFSSPCSTPVLIALLAVVAGGADILWGGLLLLCYAIGHGFLSVLAGTGVGFIKRISTNKNYGKFSLILNIIMGSLILIFGLYMFYMAV